MASPTPTKVTVSTIKSRLLRPALTSHYICRFSPTTKNRKLIDFLKEREREGFIGADYENRTNQDVLELSCSEASLPGVNYLTNEINDDFHGITERYAYRRSYDDRMDFTFYVDRDYRPINLFESWMAFIAGEKSRKAPADRTYFYRVEFPDNYTTDDLYITKFERDIGTPDQGPSLTYKFINAYPININTMPVSYESSQLLKCTVSFTFSRYIIEKTAGGSGNSGTSGTPGSSGTSPTQSGPTPAPGVPSPSIGNPNAPQSIPAVPGAPSQGTQFGGSAPGVPSFGGSPLTAPSTAPGVPSTSSLSSLNQNIGASNQASSGGIDYNKSAGTGAVFNTGSSAATGGTNASGSSGNSASSGASANDTGPALQLF